MALGIRKPKGISGNVHHITPANAKGPQSLDWAYVGFALYHLELGEGISKLTGTNELALTKSSWFLSKARQKSTRRGSTLEKWAIAWMCLNERHHIVSISPMVVVG